MIVQNMTHASKHMPYASDREQTSCGCGHVYMTVGNATARDMVLN